MIVDPKRGPDLFPGFSFKAGTEPDSISSFTRGQEEIVSLNHDLTESILGLRHRVLLIIRDLNVAHSD